MARVEGSRGKGAARIATAAPPWPGPGASLGRLAAAAACGGGGWWWVLLRGAAARVGWRGAMILPLTSPPAVLQVPADSNVNNWGVTSLSWCWGVEEPCGYRWHQQGAPYFRLSTLILCVPLSVAVANKRHEGYRHLAASCSRRSRTINMKHQQRETDMQVSTEAGRRRYRQEGKQAGRQEGKDEVR